MIFDYGTVSTQHGTVHIYCTEPKQKSNLRASSSRRLASISLLGGYFGSEEGSHAYGSLFKKKNTRNRSNGYYPDRLKGT